MYLNIGVWKSFCFNVYQSVRTTGYNLLANIRKEIKELGMFVNQKTSRCVFS